MYCKSMLLYTTNQITAQYHLLRDDLIPISKDKNRDPIGLFADDVNEKVHHGFFQLLPHVKGNSLFISGCKLSIC
ncbi:hypothetical protein DPMN_027048 [Dreissena polymorpha]|uniref:Uncharacterized protein n=1 Tax=Dreissena polymorpha TaxID=45954 RepID=A0A9D4LU12_DREPO|nr:hypothetical protein DPMN_027048 [Dreissena polymorpha]